MSDQAAPLDPVIHAQARLRIMATLAGLPQGDEMVFPRLRDLLGMTAGNLSTHLGKLEEAGYVSQSKTFAGRTPATYLAPDRQGTCGFRGVHPRTAGDARRRRAVSPERTHRLPPLTRPAAIRPGRLHD